MGSRSVSTGFPLNPEDLSSPDGGAHGRFCLVFHLDRSQSLFFLKKVARPSLLLFKVLDLGIDFFLALLRPVDPRIQDHQFFVVNPGFTDQLS